MAEEILVQNFTQLGEIIKAKSSNIIFFLGRAGRKYRIVTGFDKSKWEYYVVGHIESGCTTKTHLLEYVKKMMLELWFKEKEEGAIENLELDLSSNTSSHFVVSIIQNAPDTEEYKLHEDVLAVLLDDYWRCLHYQIDSRYTALEDYVPKAYHLTLDKIFSKKDISGIVKSHYRIKNKQILFEADWFIDEDTKELYINHQSFDGEDACCIEGYTREVIINVQSQKTWDTMNFSFIVPISSAPNAEQQKKLGEGLRNILDLTEYRLEAVETKEAIVDGEKFTKEEIHTGASFFSNDGYKLGEGERDEEVLLTFLEDLWLNRHSKNLTLKLDEAVYD